MLGREADGALDMLRDRWALQAGVLVAWLAFWAVPVAREVLAARDPVRWPRPRGPILRVFDLTDERLTQPLVALLTVSVPLFALLFSTDIWTTPDALWGWVALAGALIYAGSWLPLRRWGVAPRVVSAHAVAAAVLLAVALQFFFSSHTLLLTWAVEAAALHWMARRLGDRAVSVTAHALFVVAATWLAQRLLIEFWTREVFNAQAAVDLAVIAAAGLTCRFLDSAQARRWYGLAAFAALVAWLARELAPFTYGQGYTLVAWALVGVALLVTARRVGDRSYTSAAHLLFALAGLWVAARLMTDVESGVAFADPDRVLDLLVIGVGFATSWLSPSSAERDGYRLAVHALLLGWLWRSLQALPAGEAFVSIAWGVYGIGLLVFGLRRDIEGVRQVGLVTLVLLVTKLFLVDLSQLEPIWRVLLFMGFGGLFLVLSYYFRAQWKKTAN
jgi:uncharacterized membrane protein